MLAGAIKASFATVGKYIDNFAVADLLLQSPPEFHIIDIAVERLKGFPGNGVAGEE